MSKKVNGFLLILQCFSFRNQTSGYKMATITVPMNDWSESMNAPTKLTLRFSHDVIEHLGLKLYQNKPTNVISELISNSWDADAKKVWIELNDQGADGGGCLSVADSGVGMSFNQINDEYLIVARKRRGRDNSIIKSKGGRGLMGRKGIGKLAPFGIADVIETMSISLGPKGNRFATWFRMNLRNILNEQGIDQRANRTNGLMTEYPPEIIAQNLPISEIDLTQDTNGEIARFIARLDGSTGTIVLLKDLKVKRKINEDTLIAALGRRFTVTLLDPNFTVFVNGKRITEEHAMPEFEFRIPNTGTTTIDLSGKEIRFWVGFVKTASWPMEESGVGIYAHGKIAQDRPYFFKVKGREIKARYMYAVVEADWLDELKEDLISTDRTSIDWENEETQVLFDWGAQSVKDWIKAYTAYREDKDKKALGERLQEGINKKQLPRISEAEQSEIVRLASKITPKIEKNEDTQLKLLSTITDAWIQKPMRRIIKTLWTNLSKEEYQSPEIFATLLEQLNEHKIPESLSFAVAFAQRGYALTMLKRLVGLKKEKELQKLIEKFPWIICPDQQVLTADKSLGSMVKEAEKNGLIAYARDETLGVSDRREPDFVYFSASGQTEIFVVELKRPDEPLTQPNMIQLEAYCSYIRTRFPSTELKALLLGSGATKKFAEEARAYVDVQSWDELINHSRFIMLKQILAAWQDADPDSGDERVQDIRDFAGKDMLELMRKISANDERYEGFFNDVEKAVGEA